MDLENQLIGALGGTATGGGIMLLIAKWWLQRNEAKHTEHESRHKEMMGKLGELSGQIIELTVRVKDMVGISEKVAVLRAELDRNTKDINVAHQRLRGRLAGKAGD